MRVLIIVFSPAGSTMKIAGALEERLIAANNQVQILNVTANKAMFRDGKFKETLEEKVEAHEKKRQDAPCGHENRSLSYSFKKAHGKSERRYAGR